MTIDENLKAVLSDLRKTSEQIASDKNSYFKQFIIPPTIGLDGGGMVFIGNDGVNAIHSVAKAVRENTPGYKRSVNQQEMAERVRRAIGKIIARGRHADSSKYDLPTDEEVFCADVRSAITAEMEALDTIADHIFGAWVIQGDTVQSLQVGPVCFELRENWLQRAQREGLLSEEPTAACRTYWAASTPPKPDDARVREVVEAIGPCPWVCSVRVTGHSIERSKMKALVAARIALAGISLAWQSPSSQGKETGLIWDLGPFQLRHSMFFVANGGYGASHQSVLRLGRYLPAEDAAAFLTANGQRLETIGRALETFLAVQPAGSKRRMEEVLCQALIWFYEACIEPLEFMAIVKFAAALDTMARGMKAKGITALIKQRLAIADEKAPLLNDGTSLQAVVKQVYDTGRSQIVHGTSASLIDDLEQLRARAELITTSTLRACSNWLGSYGGADDVGAYTSIP